MRQVQNLENYSLSTIGRKYVVENAFLLEVIFQFDDPRGVVLLLVCPGRGLPRGDGGHDNPYWLEQKGQL